MEAAAALQEGQGEAPGLQRMRTRAHDASSTLATMHDAADSDSETEAVQEAATVAGAGGAGFGAENDVPPAAEREVSVVSNASNGPEAAMTEDDASLVQGAAHSAFAGGGVPQQGASAVLGGAAAGVPGNSQAVAADAAGGEIQSSGRPAAAGQPALAPAASTLTSPASVPMQQPPPPAFDPPSAAAQLAGALSIAEPSTSAAADPTPIIAQPAGSENASAQGNGLFAGAGATPASRAVGPAESVGMPAPAGSVGMNVPQAQARGLPRRNLQPGFSLTSGAGAGGAAAAAASGQLQGAHRGHDLRGPGGREAASRPPPAPLRAGSADIRGAASTDAQIGSVAPGREAAADDAAATFSVSAAHSQDSQAGSRGGAGGDTPRGPSTAGQSGLVERPPPAAHPSQSALSGQSPAGGRAPSGSGADDSAGPAGASQAPRPQNSRKRKRPASAADEIAFAIRDAARDRDPLRALAEYDRGVAGGVAMKPDSYASLLYLCAGGDGWEARARARADDPEQAAPAAAQNGMGVESAAAAAPEPAGLLPNAAASAANGVDYQMLYQRGREVFESMQQKGLPLTETGYTSLARMAASAGDGAAALAAAQSMVAAGISPRLRSFTPALLAFSTAGQVDEAFGVADTLGSLGIDLTEAEFAALLHVCQFDAGWVRAEALLRRVGRELTTLSTGTLATARSLFGSPAAVAAFADGTPLAGTGWQLSEVTVDSTGRESGNGEQVAAFDLDDGEWAAFSDGIARLAAEQERKANDFETFRRWLDANGPFGCVIDGANVALYGQNFADGGFDFGQIETAVQHVRGRHPGFKPLVVLHAGRTKGPKAAEPRSAHLMAQWRAAKTFYTTPFGSNDDWYWMYAAVRAGQQGILVSNDEMRDHIFQLLAPKFFFKWKQRHQVRYHFDGGRHFTTTYPPPYSTATQQLPSGAWLLPGSDGTWLAARPAA